ncbi:hypothetical protein E4U43_001530 [Claviceps pusilla]|uniref:Uncharacterized protein n=1 Tax=Claviceps pusilla TaxID=123648 RepID=A0A9P7NA04_9HYPO|nr:hypothetical protein E4U43_001530 [Claviceps pusilla]
MVVRVEDPAELAEASDGGLVHGPEIPVGWLASLSQAKWRSPLFPEQSSRNGVARRGMAWHGAAWRDELDIARRRSALVSVRGSSAPVWSGAAINRCHLVMSRTQKCSHCFSAKFAQAHSRMCSGAARKDHLSHLFRTPCLARLGTPRTPGTHLPSWAPATVVHLSHLEGKNDGVAASTLTYSVSGSYFGTWMNRNHRSLSLSLPRFSPYQLSSSPPDLKLQMPSP